MWIDKDKFDDVIKTFGTTHVLSQLDLGMLSFAIAGLLYASDYTFIKAHKMLEFIGVEEDERVNIDAIEKFLCGGFAHQEKLPLINDQGFNKPDAEILIKMLKEAAKQKPEAGVECK